MDGTEQLLSSVGALVELDDPAQLPYLLADPLRDLIPYDFLVYNEIDTSTGAIVTISSPGGVESRNAAFEAFAYQHPLINYYQRTRDSNVMRLSDHIGRSELRRLELYNQFLHLFGIEEMIVCTLPAAPQVAIGMVLTRERSDFSADECARLSMVRPYVLRAYRAARRRREVQQRLDAIDSALSEGGRAVIALDAHDEVVATSADTGRLLSTYGAGPVETLAHRVGRGLSQSFARNGARLVVTRAGPALLLDEEADPLDAGHLSSLGLSAREAEVLRAVRRGSSNKDIADELGIAIRTVKKHLERIYDKLGVESRTAALAVAAGGRD